MKDGLSTPNDSLASPVIGSEVGMRDAPSNELQLSYSSITLSAVTDWPCQNSPNKSIETDNPYLLITWNSMKYIQSLILNTGKTGTSFSNSLCWTNTSLREASKKSDWTGNENGVLPTPNIQHLKSFLTKISWSPPNRINLRSKIRHHFSRGLKTEFYPRKLVFGKQIQAPQHNSHCLDT